MSSAGQILEVGAGMPRAVGEAHWYALHTYPRHEKKVAAELAQKGITTYLPLVTETHQWSDRRKLVELPLFPCYTFVRIAPSNEMRVAVLRTLGVIGLVGAQKQGVPIPDSQIEDVRMLLANEIAFTHYPFLKLGQRVHICGGSLDGMEGILVGRSGERRLVISVESIQRSLAISVEGYKIEPA